MRDRIAVGFDAIGQHGRLARDLGVRFVAVAPGLIVGRLRLFELGDIGVERVFRERLLGVEVAIGGRDAFCFAQVGVALGDIGVGGGALLRSRGAAVAQTGLRPGALVDVVERGPLGGPITVQSAVARTAISVELARSIAVVVGAGSALSA